MKLEMAMKSQYADSNSARRFKVCCVLLKNDRGFACDTHANAQNLKGTAHCGLRREDRVVLTKVAGCCDVHGAGVCILVSKTG